MDLQQELKSLKSNVEEILKTQKNNKSCDRETEKAPPANIKKTSVKSTGNPSTPLMMIANEFVKKRTSIVNQNAKLLKRTYF